MLKSPSSTACFNLEETLVVVPKRKNQRDYWWIKNTASVEVQPPTTSARVPSFQTGREV